MASVSRSVRTGVLVGLGVAACTVAVGFSIIAMPLYMLARVTSIGRGLDDPFIRHGLLYVALPVGVLLGVSAGAAVGWWYAKGGRLPDWRAGLYERAASPEPPGRFDNR